jgi:glutamine synthetase
MKLHINDHVKFLLCNLAEKLKANNSFDELIALYAANNLFPIIGAEIEFHCYGREDIVQIAHYPVKKEKGRFQYEINIEPAEPFRAIAAIAECFKVLEAHAQEYDIRLSPKPFENDYGNALQLHVNFLRHCEKVIARRSQTDEAISWFLEEYKIKHRSKLAGIASHSLAMTGECHCEESLDDVAISSFLEEYKKKYLSQPPEVASHSLAMTTNNPFDNPILLSHCCDILCENMLSSFLIFAPTEECYKRFDGNFLAPTNVSKGFNNRTTALRIPSIGAKRIEYRIGAHPADPFLMVYTLLSQLKMVLIDGGVGRNYDFIYGNAHDAQYELEKFPTSLEDALLSLRG